MVKGVKMIYDFYASFRIESKGDVNNLASGLGKYEEIKDLSSRVLLLNTAYGIKEKFPDEQGRPNRIYPVVYARVGERNNPTGLKALIHSNRNYDNYIACKLSDLSLLNINSSIDLSMLPEGSWILEFPITLEKPFLSQDDIPLYIIDNPIRKDKVFGIPFTSPMAWKGNLRWTMMKIFLEPKTNQPNEFAETRFQHTLLFGTEKGWEEKPVGWTRYLDNLCPDAKTAYRKRLKEFFRKEKAEDVHLEGMLYFYPTFWNKMDIMVINPHYRKTKTGKNPIYFEVLPEGAEGVFRLVYVPFYWFGLLKDKLMEKVIEDLDSVIKGVKEMMLTYGFSAKKSSGFGLIKNSWNKDESRVEIKGFYNTKRFSDFEELKKVVNIWRDKSE
jgi:CRISPR-associated protein Cmr2